jgi:hypothetical protein
MIENVCIEPIPHFEAEEWRGEKLDVRLVQYGSQSDSQYSMEIMDNAGNRQAMQIYRRTARSLPT